MRRRLLTPGDIVLVLVLLVLAGLSFMLLRRTGEARLCEVQAGGEKTLIELPADTTIVVTGPVGKTVVLIEGNAARVVESDCSRKLCVRAGSISRPGGVIVCVPNEVVVRLRGGELDAITR